MLMFQIQPYEKLDIHPSRHALDLRQGRLSEGRMGELSVLRGREIEGEIVCVRVVPGGFQAGVDRWFRAIRGERIPMGRVRVGVTSVIARIVPTKIGPIESQRVVLCRARPSLDKSSDAHTTPPRETPPLMIVRGIHIPIAPLSAVVTRDGPPGAQEIIARSMGRFTFDPPVRILGVRRLSVRVVRVVPLPALTLSATPIPVPMSMLRAEELGIRTLSIDDATSRAPIHRSRPEIHLPHPSSSRPHIILRGTFGDITRCRVSVRVRRPDIDRSPKGRVVNRVSPDLGSQGGDVDFSGRVEKTSVGEVPTGHTQDRGLVLPQPGASGRVGGLGLPGGGFILDPAVAIPIPGRRTLLFPRLPFSFLFQLLGTPQRPSRFLVDIVVATFHVQVFTTSASLAGFGWDVGFEVEGDTFDLSIVSYVDVTWH